MGKLRLKASASAAAHYFRQDFGYNDVMLAWLKRHVLSLLFVLAGLSLVPAYLHAYNLIGQSDIPTLLLGDKVVVNSAAYHLKMPYSNVTLFRTGLPKRGDLVLLHILNDPGLRSVFFKRIMGLPGETIEIRENRVIVKGRTIPVRPLNPADFAWVPQTHPIGSVVLSPCLPQAGPSHPCTQGTSASWRVQGFLMGSSDIMMIVIYPSGRR